MPAKDPLTPAPVPTPATTLRLTFAYRGRDVQLVATQRVAMIAPPSVTPAPAQGQSGYWIELRGATGDLLFHRALSSPVRADVEVFADDAGQSMQRVPVPSPEGQFDVLVPDLPAARTFVFFGAPSGAASEAAPSREVFRAEMNELRKPRSATPAPDTGPAQKEGDRK
jgi:hypothetical protein